jgi:hypothetical protein
VAEDISHLRTVITMTNDCSREIRIRDRTVDAAVTTVTTEFRIIKMYGEAATAAIVNDVIPA